MKKLLVVYGTELHVRFGSRTKYLANIREIREKFIEEHPEVEWKTNSQLGVTLHVSTNMRIPLSLDDLGDYLIIRLP